MPPSRAQRAKIAERRRQAIALRLAGVGWDDIARQLGYSDRGAACKDVDRAMKASLAEQRQGAETLRELELRRLDAVTRAMWPAAMGGDTRSAGVVLQASDRRVQLVGLGVQPDVEQRIRQQVTAQVGTQVALVFGRVMDGLGLSAEQRALVPALLEQAIAWFEGRDTDGPGGGRLALEGELVDGNEVEGGDDGGG